MISKLRQFVPNWLVNHLWHLPKAVLANLYYGFPSKKLTVIGITGTSGKTTTAHLIYHLLQKNGFKTALISTISAKIGKQEIDIGLHVTNPDPFLLQKLLKRIVGQGCDHLILEVTSHGLDQHRVWGIQFDYGVLLNITHEHLDYHKSFKNYQKTKFKLIKNSRIAVLNVNHQSYSAACQLAPGKVINFRSQQIKSLPGALVGSFNKTNVAAASAVVKNLGVAKEDINKALQTFPGIPGRMEFIQTSPFTIIIDFAHKPDALEKALRAIKKLKGKKGRLISVFGSAGLRDVQKRPLMGKISAQLSDITILTAEDPRTENVNHIINQIEAGWQKAKGKQQLFKQPDRQLAINLAIKLAKPGDYVALFGKAHEKSICFGTIEHPWSEHQAVQKALKARKSDQ
jgi:UDP-N-acetylmuramoyl-L-alanyl-D-glutamate--2,6-diaminopimelate ligase